MTGRGGRTPSQTIGPFFSVGLPWAAGPCVVDEGTPGAIWLRGQVLDGQGDPVPDAMVETWQADPDGRFGSTHAIEREVGGFRGFGRSCADAEGRYAIVTLKPGPVPAGDGSLQAPHVDVSLFARGLLKRLVTRIYFADEPEANERDAVLASITDRAARATLIAHPADDGYRFDVRLQGDGETVFFDV
jgi:protocatechuate 3,4-dioxygenase alpha subunit